MTKKTVFVIGAGASKEANLPVGEELKNIIADLLDLDLDHSGNRLADGDRIIEDALISLSQNKAGYVGCRYPYLSTALDIRNALPQAISIDNFIDQHRDNEKIAQCAKLAIVRAILQAEKSSLLYFEQKNVTINFKSLEKTWYAPFFKLITEHCSANDLIERFKSITLIIFNYDRCIEHFLYYSLQNVYNIPANEAAELIKNITIYHPYGSVGSLPWISKDGAMEFGAEPRDGKNLLEISQQIKTFRN